MVRSQDTAVYSDASNRSDLHPEEFPQLQQKPSNDTTPATVVPVHSSAPFKTKGKGFFSFRRSKSPQKVPYHVAAAVGPPICHYPPPPPYGHFAYPPPPYYPRPPHISSSQGLEQKMSSHQSPSVEAQPVSIENPSSSASSSGNKASSKTSVPKAAFDTSTTPPNANSPHIHPDLPPPPSYYPHYPPWPYHPAAMPPFPPMFPGGPHGPYRGPFMVPPGHPSYSNHMKTMDPYPENSVLPETSPSSAETNKCHSNECSPDRLQRTIEHPTSLDDSNMSKADMTETCSVETVSNMILPSVGHHPAQVPPKDPPKKRFKRSLFSSEAIIPVEMETGNLSLEPSISMESSKSGLEFDSRPAPSDISSQHSLSKGNTEDLQGKVETMVTPDKPFGHNNNNHSSLPFYSKSFRFSSPFQSSTILPLPQQPTQSKNPKWKFMSPRQTNPSQSGHSNENINTLQASSIQMGVSKLSIYTKQQATIQPSDKKEKVSPAVLERRARKNENSRIRASRLKFSIAAIQKKNPSERTREESDTLQLYEERRKRKNERSRELAIEKKQRMDEIMLKPESEWTQEEKAFIEETMTAKYRKNLGDRLRRKRIKEKVSSNSSN